MTTHPVQMVSISCPESGLKDRILGMFHGLGAAGKIWKDFSGTSLNKKNFYCMSFANSCNKYPEITFFSYFLPFLWEICVCIIHKNNLNHHELYKMDIKICFQQLLLFLYFYMLMYMIILTYL